MNKKIKGIAGLVIVLVIVFCGYLVIRNSNQISTGPIKIGAILPLTGEMASYGEGWKNSILLAIENSGLKDRVQLIIEDDASCASSQDVTAAQKLVNIDNVKAIVGPGCSSAFLSVLPVTEKNKVILISSSATSKSISGSGNYIFRTVSSDSDKAIAVADVAYNNGYKKAAFLYDASSDAFVQQREDVKTEFVKLGGQVVGNESFQTSDTDFRSQLIKIKNSGADVIFVGFFPTTKGALVFKQAKELGVKLQFITSTPEMGTADFTKIAGNLAEGLIFPSDETLSSVENTNFINSYKERFGKDPAGYGPETYDAAMLLLKAVSKSSGSPDSIKKELYSTGQNYNGASGVIYFKKNGDVIKPVSIKTIKNGQFVLFTK